MTLTDVLKDFAYLSVLLLIGFELRKRITLFQRYFYPHLFDCRNHRYVFQPQLAGRSVSCLHSVFQWHWAVVGSTGYCCVRHDVLEPELNQVGRDGMATTFFGRCGPPGADGSWSWHRGAVRGAGQHASLSVRLHGRLGFPMRATAMPPPWVTSSRMPACGTMQWAWA